MTIEARMVSPDHEFETPLDEWIAPAVMALRHAGIATEESCDGGLGHAFPEPTIRFGGDYAEALRAVSIAIREGLPVYTLRHVWRMDDGELIGPLWEITFTPQRPWWSTTCEGRIA
jgi:hypothetical protein